MVSTEKLISEMEKHSILYDICHDQYNNKSAKVDAWYAVGKALIPEWDRMTPEEREVEDKILRNKWRNIRDCFVKEYKWQAKFSSTKRRRKKYAYYDQLLFLTPSMQAKAHDVGIISVQCKTENNHVPMDEVNDESSLPSVLSTDEKDFLYVQQNTVADGKDKHQFPMDPLCDEPASYDDDNQNLQPTNNNLQIKASDETDYDKMFLLSLLPSFRQIPEHMKLQVRIQFQQILVSTLNPNNTSANK